MTADEHRRIFVGLMSEIRVHPRQRGGMQNSRFDPSRIEFVWRSEGLARAAGWDNDAEKVALADGMSDFEKRMLVVAASARKMVAEALGGNGDTPPPIQWATMEKDSDGNIAVR